jgi:hypothetical protein
MEDPMKQQEQDRGPGARKIKLERHLDANADAANRNFGSAAREDDAAREADAEVGGQQASPRGHKGQLAHPHRSGRPSGGNIRTREKSR